MNSGAVDISDWLESLVVWPVLFYRRLRYGYTFRRIRMSQPRYSKVDPADYKRLRKYEWLARKGTNSFYAQRPVPSGKVKKGLLIYMHHAIIEVPAGMVIDHINHDGMDNRSANLRSATRSQNMCHRKKRPGTKHSKYKGVCWKKRNRKWVARINFENKEIHLGCFCNEIDAAKAYDAAAIKYHKEFAVLNFPKSKVRPRRKWFGI